MKLKNIFALAALGLSFAACDDIKESERFIPVTPNVTAEKNVLIEDFTGMLCVNCPNAANEIHNIQSIYGADKVIAVAIHGEMPGLSGPLANALGTEYYKHWGVETLPAGMVDRQGLQQYSSWSATATSRLNADVTPLSLSMANNAYDATNRALTIQVEALAGADLNGNLQVWLTESKIQSFQLMPDGELNRNYTHNHVLRDAVNGAYGEAVALKMGEAQTLTYAYTVPEEWNAENLAVVAFVYNESGVVQVIEQALFECEPSAPVVKSEFAFAYNGAALEDGATLTLEAQEGVAETLAEALVLQNLGAQPLVATVTLEQVENLTGVTYTLKAFGELTTVQTEAATLSGSIAQGETAAVNLAAAFATGVYGTAKAKLTVETEGVTKTLLVNFVNPEPAASGFQLVYNGTPLEDGATLDINAVITDLTQFMPDYYIVEAKTNDEANALNIHNLSGETLSAKVNVEVLEDVTGTTYSLCSFGECTPVTGGAGEKMGEIAPYGEAETGWDVTFTHGVTGTVKTKLTVTAGEQVQTVFVNFVYEAAEETPAGTIQLVYNGTPLEDGATLNIDAVITDLTQFMPDYYIVEAKTNDEVNALNIRNLTGEDVSATVNVEVLEDVTGTTYSLCSFGECTPVTGGAGEKVGTILANSEATTGWDITFTHGITGTAKTKLTVTVGEEVKTVFVNFVYE